MLFFFLISPEEGGIRGERKGLRTEPLESSREKMGKCRAYTARTLIADNNIAKWFISVVPPKEE